MTPLKQILLLSAALVLAACGNAAAPPPAQKEHAHGAAGAHGKDEATAENAGDGDHAEAIVLSAEARQAAGLVIAAAGPATLVESLPLYGVVKPNAERMRSVGARFPGVVRSVAVKVGDAVRQGQALASVESNESLQVYTTTSPLAGVVTERLTNPGEQAENAPLFTIADLSTVWIELSLFPRDRGRVQLGQDVRVSATEGELSGQGKLVFVSPLGSGATQTVTARVLLDNAQGQWAPGLYVRAEVVVGRSEVALAVPVAALQELDEGGLSVFVDSSSGLQPRPVKTGRNDGRFVEILGGIAAGENVVGEGSFVLKAEQGKGGAEHDH
ncbi:cobalt-zinc-cadmium efflux system membrane fusion protein [Tahibacter aquaticus]|uniref:Cobalt-zinc-cadmium efflux system membrane fusion protein n=1 Tax=Tahibacter aquaticus TaxID=520092 RepID=A0A4R6Z094_9GAMM|nr:efflux RND transporter periplasmic adaptor subunit [Tahibacter aquaticus]TDR44931.1 cobalt-zinc-cadmium efflux system membrane fusion protein [Tahibacter aquaticus]